MSASRARVLLVGSTRYVHVRRWARGLAACGVDLLVLSDEDSQLDGVPIVGGQPKPWRPWRPYRWQQRKRTLLKSVLANWDPAIVHVHMPGPFSLFPEDLGHRRLVVSPWGADMLPYRDESQEHKRRKVAILQRADKIVALSNYLRDATAAYASVAAAEMSVQRWGVDLEAFSPAKVAAAANGERPVIGFAKAFTEQYGARFLVEAFARVSKEYPQAILRMMGSGKQETELRQRAQDLGIGRSIEWLGVVPEQQLPQEFSRMTLSVMPSVLKSETLGVAALESQAMQVPVVATRIGGIPEAVIDGETGALVPPEDADAIADAILKILADRSHREQLGRAGRRHVELNFDWKQTLQKMVETYEELAT